MNKSRFLVILLFYLWVFHLNAQTPKGLNFTENKLINYFSALRESVFLHVNKTDFIPGEEVWFKAYIYDRKNQIPFEESTNLNIAIYDSVGDQIDRKLIYVNNGYGSGSVEIDSSFQPGKYYLKASTNWMKNFKEDDSFIQEFKVLKSNIQVTPRNKIIDFDVQFLPEGGNAIEGAINTIGVKVINRDGLGVDIEKGTVRDEQGKKVAEFHTTKYGLGKFLYQPRKGVDYYAEILFENGVMETMNLPKPLSEGITIALEPKGEEKMVVFLATNTASLNKLLNRKFTLLIHRDGILKKINVKFNSVDTTYAFVIDKEFLLEGMNIFTLIDERGTPLLERLYFNSHKKNIPQVDIKYIKKEFDSLVFEIRAKDKYESVKNLSLSVLPSGTNAYRQNQNINSTFNLKPYVRGYIENPAFYFNDFRHNKEEDLDLLLLTQGWSRYEWRKLNSPPREIHAFEHGIDLRGRINMKVDIDDKVVLFPTKNHVSIIENLNQNKFEIPNLILINDEILNFSLLKKNKKLINPKIYIELQDKLSKDIFEVYYPTVLSAEKKVNKKDFNFDNFAYKGAVELDEVKLEGNSRNKADSNINVAPYLRDKVTEVTEETEFNYQYITDIIKSRGYDVRLGLIGANIDRVSIRVKSGQSLLGIPDLTLPEPIIYIDDKKLFNFDDLYNVPTSSFEGFYFQRSGASEGVRGGGGVIRLYSKRGINNGDNTKRKAQSAEYRVKNGFELSKKFYTPKYRSYVHPAFKRYGTIHWAKEIIIKPKEKVKFRIFNTGIEDLTFYFQGMGENGSLISGKQEISLK